jgi:Uma2 family endonuclease
MASTTLDLLAPVHRLSIDDYRRMHEVGLFDGDLRVELIEGVVVEMSPIGRVHERAVTWLTRALVLQLAETELVSPQNSIVLAELRSMPQPDIAIRTTAEMLERAADRPLLIIEVADSSLRFDRITKSRLYARHGIEDYWIVNVADEAVEVHRDPAGDGWRSRTVHGAGDVLRPLLLPEVAVELGPLLDFAGARTT